MLVYGHYYSAISVIACLQIAASVGHERRGLSHVVNMATRAGAEGNMANIVIFILSTPAFTVFTF